jgi:hypothetical protein
MHRLRRSAFATLSEFSSTGGSGYTVEEERRLQKAEFEARCLAAADDGFKRGVAAGREEVTRDYERQMLELRAQFEERLEAERQMLSVEQAERYSRQLDDSVRQVAADVERKVAALLKPWLKEQLHARAVADFESSLKRSLSVALSIHARGPQAMLDRLRDLLGERAGSCVFQPCEDTAIDITVDETVIAADFSAWMEGWEAQPS